MEVWSPSFKRPFVFVAHKGLGFRGLGFREGPATEKAEGVWPKDADYLLQHAWRRLRV